ncbi:MAG: nucleotide exchange factor GrpE [Candidatus Daviesbacteria bacterium]|nr:nucleotide exchange factor GrpE [Candidatus Daviesbacteria bacterium]
MAKKQTQLEELGLKVQSLEDQLKRAVADYQNLEKRIQDGRSELTKWASGDLVMRILPTLDHLDTALGGASEGDKASGWYKGVELAVKEFKKVLEEEGLQTINIQIMDEYDPRLAEAVETKEGEENKVLEIVQNGYNMNGKVIRPAKVVVGKKEN